MNLLSLVRSKNRCLEQLRALSEAFLCQPPEALLDPSELSPLGEYERNRSAIFKAIELYDRKIDEAVSITSPSEMVMETREAIRGEITRGERLIAEVLVSDREITRRFQEAQAAIASQITQSRQHRDKLSRFKSTWVPASGDEVDTKL